MTDDKPTKKQANYTLPEQCCEFCKHSMQNGYGDYTCKILAPDTIGGLANICKVDAGAVCKFYVSV